MYSKAWTVFIFRPYLIYLEVYIPLRLNSMKERMIFCRSWNTIFQIDASSKVGMFSFSKIKSIGYHDVLLLIFRSEMALPRYHKVSRRMIPITKYILLREFYWLAERLVVLLMPVWIKFLSNYFRAMRCVL